MVDHATYMLDVILQLSASTQPQVAAYQVLRLRRDKDVQLSVLALPQSIQQTLKKGVLRVFVEFNTDLRPQFVR